MEPRDLPGHTCPPHRLWFRVAGLTVEIATAEPIPESALPVEAVKFRTAAPGEDRIRICHEVLDSPPVVPEPPPGEEVYADRRMRIFHSAAGGGWTYFSTPNPEPDTGVPRWPVQGMAVFNDHHSHGCVSYGTSAIAGGMLSLSVFTADQVFLATALAARDALMFHSASAIVNGQGLLFLGHSGAGKSTLSKMLLEAGEVLCDERNLVRMWPDGPRLHGTWHHGTFARVSPSEAPLRALFLLEQATENAIVPLADRRELIRRLPFYVIKPVMTSEWTERSLALMGAIAAGVPAYLLRFDRSGGIAEVLRRFDAPGQP